mgnify:CR=1 FL=1
MKIRTDSYGNLREYESLENYAANQLDGDDYGVGRLEAAAATAENNSRAIGRLLDILAAKNVITADEAVKTVEGFFNGTADFCT